MFVVGIGFSLPYVAPNTGYKNRPSDEVADKDRQKGQTSLIIVEVPCFVYKSERLDLHKDKSIGESGQERERKDDRLCKEHFERPSPRDKNFLDRETFTQGDKFARTISVTDTLLSAPLRDLIDHNGGTGFRDQEEMSNLHGDTKDKLDPDTPSPWEELLDEATNHGPENTPSYRTENYVRNSILLVVCFENIRNHAQRHGSTSRG